MVTLEGGSANNEDSTRLRLAELILQNRRLERFTELYGQRNNDGFGFGFWVWV